MAGTGSGGSSRRPWPAEMGEEHSAPGARLRQLIARPEALVLPGAADAWTARLIVHCGYPAVYVTGAGIANTMLGVPDIGLTTFSEMLEQTRRIVNSVGVPVLADIDTGFGGIANVQRTIRAYERAGVAAVHIEDQEMPKRCGHFNGKTVIPAQEMVAKVHAAVSARQTDDLMIIARTDARSVESLDAAIERAKLYLDAGADGIFVEALDAVTSSSGSARNCGACRSSPTWLRAGSHRSWAPRPGRTRLRPDRLREPAAAAGRYRHRAPTARLSQEGTSAACWTTCCRGRTGSAWWDSTAWRRPSGPCWPERPRSWPGGSCDGAMVDTA